MLLLVIFKTIHKSLNNQQKTLYITLYSIKTIGFNNLLIKKQKKLTVYTKDTLLLNYNADHTNLAVKFLFGKRRFKGHIQVLYIRYNIDMQLCVNKIF